MGIDALVTQRHGNRHGNKCTVCQKGMEIGMGINALIAKKAWE